MPLFSMYLFVDIDIRTETFLQRQVDYIATAVYRKGE